VLQLRTSRRKNKTTRCDDENAARALSSLSA
jgi:hypothetical protein